MALEARIFAALSLDGRLADGAGDIGWLMPWQVAGEDYGHAAHLAGLDALVMGRATFDTLAAFGQWVYDLPVVVLSRSLSTLPRFAAGRAELHPGPLPALCDMLAARGIRVVGVEGGQAGRAFLAAGLVQRLTLSTVPVLLGGGPRLFGDETGAGEGPGAFTLTACRHWPNGLVQAAYRRRPAGA